MRQFFKHSIHAGFGLLAILFFSAPAMARPGDLLGQTQGTADTIVPYKVTENYFGRLCRAGNRVAFDLMPGVSHGKAGYMSASAAVEWMGDRFAGRPAPNDCRR